MCSVDSWQSWSLGNLPCSSVGLRYIIFPSMFIDYLVLVCRCCDAGNASGTVKRLGCGANT